MKRRILIVDDDRDFVEALAVFLESEGLAVARAYDGNEGVKLARMDRPDLILMDIMMRERTEGFFVIREIRNDPALRNVPIFVISSFCSRLPDLELPSSGGWMDSDMFFAKPVDSGLLLDRIRLRLGRPR